MNYELNLYMNGDVKKAFFQTPLMNDTNITKIIHNHKYPEIHIVSRGRAELLIDNEKHTFTPGNIFIIPAKIYHCYLAAEHDAEVVAFQTDIPVNNFAKCDISENIISEIVAVFNKENYHSNASELSALLSFATSRFFSSSQLRQTENYAIMIYEFISQNYNRNIQISELAQKLCLCSKQTERLVKKYTGYTFKQAVVNYRMRVADFLEKNTKLSESEIASYVGYSNYSGYWKARKNASSPKGRREIATQGQ